MGREADPVRLQRIDVVPVAAIGRDLVDLIVRRLSRRVCVPCRRVTPLAVDAVPLVRGREQADADGLLLALEARPVAAGTATLGVTSLDLGHPLFTFFFGRARAGGAAVVSVARASPSFYGLPDDRETLLRRAVAECLHELGHVAGLHHCKDWRCLMRFSGDVEMVDVRGEDFCEACAAQLPSVFLRPGRV